LTGAAAVWCLVSIQAAQAPSGSAKTKKSTKATAAATKTRTPFTTQDRLDAIRRAQVWTAVDIPSMDINAGPKGSDGFMPDQRVTCDYVQHSKGSGTTPKFRCKTPNEELKVRYGNRNGEVYAQVAASRLLWALGFGGNRMVPVKVACNGCPYDPFANNDKPGKEVPSKIVLFDPATIDIKMTGTTLETKLDEGWAWPELDKFDDKAGSAQRAQRDALKLLAVMIQHTDSKASNQRLLCLDKELAKKAKKSAAADGPAAASPVAEPAGAEVAADATGACAHPFMMLTDVGKTFGHASAMNSDVPSAVNFKEWSKTSIWKDPEKPGCVGNLPKSISGTLNDPRISEDGRKFLSDLLAQLTDAQLHDLFAVSLFTHRDPSATVDDWVNAFKHKRDEIAGRSCSAAS
jgi:hypothetical protein